MRYRFFSRTAPFVIACSQTFLISAAFGQVTGYLGSDNYFHLKGLDPNRIYSLDLGGQPLIRAGVSNSCGILKIVAGRTLTESDRIEIKDEKAGKVLGFENKNLPVRDTERCNGQVKPERELWKSADGTILISGLTPSSPQTIKLLSVSPSRNLKASICGTISLRLDSPPPKAILVDGKAFPVEGQSAQPGRGLFCRRGSMYVSYPAPTPLGSTSATTWKQQNAAPAFSPNAEIPTFTGNLISWGIVTGGGGGTTQTDTGGGGSGGSGGSGGATQPQPPSGKSFCKIGSSQLLVTGLTSGTNYYVGTPEDDVYDEVIADSSGRAIFDVNYSDTWEGESAEIELGKPSYRFIKNLGQLSRISLCQ